MDALVLLLIVVSAAVAGAVEVMHLLGWIADM